MVIEYYRNFLGMSSQGHLLNLNVYFQTFTEYLFCVRHCVTTKETVVSKNCIDLAFFRTTLYR